MEKNRMEIVGMERNSEWKIERKEENGWNIQEIKQKIPVCIIRTRAGRHFRQWVTGCVFRQTGAGMH